MACSFTPLLAILAAAFPLISSGATPAARVGAKATAPAVQFTALEPEIRAIHGKTVSIAVPAGYASVNLQILTAPPKGRSAPGVKPPGPTWETVSATLTYSQAAIVQLNIPRLTSRRNMRVFGVKTIALSEDLLGGLTLFPADPESTQSGGPTLSLGGTNASFSLSGTASVSSAGATSASAPRTVSESDIWKLDGDRLYFFNTLRGLQVFDLAQPDRPTLLGTVPMPGAGEQMYLLDPTHVVLLRDENLWWSWLDWDYRWNLGSPPYIFNSVSNIPLTLTASTLAIQSAYTSLRYLPSINPTHTVVVVDVSKGEPVTLAEVPFTGQLQESRLVGQVLYVATNVYGPLQPNGNLQSGLRLTSFDLSDPAHPVQRASVFSDGFASVVTATDRYFFVSGSASYPASVRAFDISDPHGAIVHAGKVEVPGIVTDKFKIDQRGNTLTVVSSGWHTEPGFLWTAFSQVSTFSMADPLKPVLLGTLAGPVGEQLYATRFDGSRLYMVTSVRNWDPLLIIDLSKPETPSILGTVEMPGFNTFIQPLGDRLVATGLVSGQPTVDLYDVSDPTAPMLLSRVSLADAENRWVNTEATWNEKAFNVLPESNLILLPTSSYGSDGYAGGVQLIDLLPDQLVKRGALRRKFVPRRAGLHGTRIVSISANELLTVKADDRDHPVVTSDVEIAWPVDATFLVGPWLLELGGQPWGNFLPTVTVAPADSPDSTVATLPLPKLDIVGSTVRDGVLYVAQVEPHYHTNYWEPSKTPYQAMDGSSLTLSTIDVSQLPGIKLLNQVKVDGASTDYLSGPLKPLWVNDRTLLFSNVTVNRPIFFANTFTLGSAGGNMLYTMAPGSVVNNAPTLSSEAFLSTASTASTAFNASNTVAAGTLQVSTSLSFQSIWWNNKTELFAFDVTAPSQPKYASHVKFGQEETWEVGAPLTANNKVYVSYRVLGKNPRETYPQGAPDPVNRHFLKVVDYSNNALPVVAQGTVNLPGALRALGQGGSVLYTVGPLLDPSSGYLKGAGRALQASSFDGATAHLLDQLPLDASTQPFVVSGDAVLLIHPQAQQLSQWDPVSGTYPTNPARTTLDTWSLGQGGKFAPGVSLKLDHELSIGQVNTLGVLRGPDPTVRLLDLRDPLHPIDLGTRPIHTNGSSSLERGDGDAIRGLWLPLGAYGVEAIPLAPLAAP